MTDTLWICACVLGCGVAAVPGVQASDADGLHRDGAEPAGLALPAQPASPDNRMGRRPNDASAVPGTYLFRGAQLARTRDGLRAADWALLPAFINLLRQADAALTTGPFTVTDKTLMPPSGDPHDYMSFGRYWWPDPRQPDGLPYIRRDGETNPDSQGAGSDRPRLGDFCDAVETLGLAYFFTGDERYADHAATLIRTWFLHPATRMNPHLSYAQGIPGREAGRKSGLLDGRLFSQVLDGVALLQGATAWSARDQDALRAWFQHYLQWLQTHELPRAESGSRNNHGTFFDVQVVHVALFAGDRDLARSVVEAAVEKRLLAQIAPDGSQPEELARTRPLFYSLFNLEAMMGLARLGEHVGVDLWRAGDERLRAGLDFVAPYADPTVAWPHPTIDEAERIRILPLLLSAADAYGSEPYRELAERLPGNEVITRREQLLFAP